MKLFGFIVCFQFVVGAAYADDTCPTQKQFSLAQRGLQSCSMLYQGQTMQAQLASEQLNDAIADNGKKQGEIADLTAKLKSAEARIKELESTQSAPKDQ